jgi:hypothetical protein
MPSAQPGPPGTKYVRLTVDVWYQESDGEIHLTTQGEGFHTTVNNRPGSKRQHENLFNRLRSMLEEHGRWPTTS